MVIYSDISRIADDLRNAEREIKKIAKEGHAELWLLFEAQSFLSQAIEALSKTLRTKTDKSGKPHGR